MSKRKNKSDFNATNVAGMSVLVSGYLKTSLVEISSVVERMVLPVDPNFEKDQVNDRLIPHPFSPKTVNNFNSSQPFGLYDIFNYLIYQSTASLRPQCAYIPYLDHQNTSISPEVHYLGLHLYPQE